MSAAKAAVDHMHDWGLELLMELGFQWELYLMVHMACQKI